MVVGFGPKLPPGHLPAYAVGSNAEAQRLLIAACPTNIAGEFIAPELADAQTLDNLDAFSARLDRLHSILEARGLCDCQR